MRRPSRWLVLAAFCVAACDLPSAQVSEEGSSVFLPLPQDGQNFAPRVLQFSCAPATGETPFTTTCAWRAADPERAAFRCTLDVDGDGQLETEIADCSRAGTFEFTFGSPGDFSAKLQAVDVPGAQAEETFSLRVTGRPNTAPVIEPFTVTPEVGFAALKATFTWKISDAENDPVSCTLDADGDGKPEYTMAACELSGTQAHTYEAAGVFEAKLVVQDRFKARREKTARVEVKRPQGEVKLAKAEWGQSLFSDSLRLVAGKKAVLRLTVLADRPALAGVKVKVEGFQNGQSLGELPAKGPDELPQAEVPGDLAKSFVATVPEAWVAPGLEVRVQADALDAIGEANEMDNALTLKPTVGAPTELHLTNVPFAASNGTGPTGALPGDALDLLYKVWPLKSVESTVRAPFTVGYAIGSDINTWSRLLNDVTSLRTADGSGRHYYGWVKVSYTSGVLGIANLPGTPEYVGPAAIGVDAIPGAPQEGPGTMAHELGHVFSRFHVLCNGNEGGPDRNYPTAGGKIREWGIDLKTMELKSPATFVDIMSYCRPPWISKYGYEQAQRHLEANPSKASFVGEGATSSQLLVSGTISGDEVRMDPVQRISSWPTAPDPASRYALVFQTARGPVRVPLAIYEMADVEPAPSGFVATVPAAELGTLQALELTRDGVTLLRRKASPPAQLTVQRLVRTGSTLEVRWTPGASLLVAHLGEDGVRTTLARDLTVGQAWLPLGSLPEGGRFEVSLSDGLNATRSVMSAR